MPTLTAEQKDQIVRRSQEAQAFLSSNLFSYLQDWVKAEQTILAQAIVTDGRTEEDKHLSRLEFVEHKGGYYAGLSTMLGVLRGLAAQEGELRKLEDHERKRTDTSQR